MKNYFTTLTLVSILLTYSETYTNPNPLIVILMSVRQNKEHAQTNQATLLLKEGAEKVTLEETPPTESNLTFDFSVDPLHPIFS